MADERKKLESGLNIIEKSCVLYTWDLTWYR